MRRLFFALLVLASLTSLVVTPASAAEFPRLTSQVTDQTGVLAGSESRIQTALDTLQREHNVQLWVVFVRTTGSTSITDFADEVAAVNSLGVNDALLVVALDDRTDAIWVSDGLPQITNDEIDRVISTAVEPRLASGDFAGAAIAAATGLGEAAGAVVVPTGAVPSPAPTAASSPVRTVAPTASSQGGTPGGSGGGGSIVPIVLILVVIAGAFLFFRSRRKPGSAGNGLAAPGSPGTDGRPTTPAAAMSPQDLAKAANAGLIEMDEAIRDANQELGFVEAQYGPAEAAGFRHDLDQAADELKQAFVLRQQLDDSVREDGPTRQRMLTEIVERTGRARSLVAQQTARVSALRDIERTAPDLLSRMPPDIERLEDRLPAAKTALEQLNSYAASTWQSVRGNLAEAEKRIDVAKTSVEAGTTAFGMGDKGLATSYVRQAQGALAETVALLDAIDRLTASLNDARTQLPGEIAAAASDIASARAAIAAQPSAPGDLATNLAQADSLLAAARAAAASAQPDVIDAYQKATQANALADTVVAGASAESDRLARRRLVAESALRSARISVGRASDFITTRRGMVGSDARTSLAEAQRTLELAMSLAGSDAEAALHNAQRAQQLADAAYQQAEADFTQFDQPEPPSPDVGQGGGSSGNAGVAGVILGEVLGGILGGGGGRGGGWGGTPWGSPSPGRGGGGGGFGRTVGGGWGGLGGRSRGGRW